MKSVILLAMIVPTLVFAASGGARGDDYIPLKEIGWQATNLGILLVIIYFGIRKSIVETFRQRKEDFIQQSEKTKSALKNAEAELKGIQEKIATLEGGERAALETAKHESNLIKANLIKEADSQAQKMKTDAELSIRAELAKAKNEINELILKEAIITASAKLTSGAPTASRAAEAQFLAQLDRSQSAKATL